ncbi:hypothetical protein D3C78_1242360 [compost metagenome]
MVQSNHGITSNEKNTQRRFLIRKTGLQNNFRHQSGRSDERGGISDSKLHRGNHVFSLSAGGYLSYPCLGEVAQVLTGLQRFLKNHRGELHSSNGEHGNDFGEGSN